MKARIIKLSVVDRENGAVNGRILALDFGKKRIGLALSDPFRWTARGLDTLTRTRVRDDVAAIARLAAEHEVTLLLVGYPLNMNGTEGLQAQAAREFGERLRRATGIPVKFWDERLTSVEAEEFLRERGEFPNRRKGVVDRIAATMLLQDYLDYLARVSRSAE